MTAKTITVKGQSITVDLLCWRHYGRRCRGTTELVLDANPGLARLGPILPIGTKVDLPALPESSRSSEVVTLWDD